MWTTCSASEVGVEARSELRYLLKVESVDFLDGTAGLNFAETL
jgi:hypothetical protein